MKNQLKSLASILMCVLLITACSDDDSTSNSPTDNELVGTWNLISLESTVALDLDDDGVASESFHEESDCVQEQITFNSDATFSGTTSYAIQFFTELEDIVCYDNTNSGTWELNDNILTIDLQDGNLFTYTISLSENTLTYNQLEGFNVSEVIATYTIE